MFGPARRYDPPEKRDACRACRSSPIRRARTQAWVRTFPFAPTATFSPDAPRSGSLCAEYPLGQKRHKGRLRGGAQTARTNSPCSPRSCMHTESPSPNWAFCSRHRSLYIGAINSRLPSTSSSPSRTLGRQVSPYICWGCRTSRAARVHPAFAITFKTSYLLMRYDMVREVWGYTATGTSNTRGNSWPATVSACSPLVRDLSR